MPEVKLGLEAVLTIDGAEITNVKDLTVSLEKAKCSATTSLLEELVDFFPKSRRALLKKSLGKFRQLLCNGCNSVSKSQQVPQQVQPQRRSPLPAPSNLSNSRLY